MLATAYGLTAVAVALVGTPDPTGYHATPFDAYPPWVRPTFTATGIAAITLLANGAYARHRRTVGFGCCALVAWMALLYALPAGAGLLFAAPSEDVVYHLGLTQGSLNAGTLVGDVIYPAAYALFVSVTLISGIDLAVLQFTLSLAFAVFFLVALATLGRHYWGPPAFALVFLAATPFVYARFHRTIHPFFLAFWLTPVVVFLFDRYAQSPHRRWAVALLPIGVLLPVFHPLAAIYIAFVIGACRLGQRLTDCLSSAEDVSSRRGYILVFIGVGIVSWIGFYAGLTERVSAVITANLAPAAGEAAAGADGGGDSVITVFLSALAKSELSIVDAVVDVLLVEYGAILLYGAVGGATTLLLAAQAYATTPERPGTIMSVVYLVGLILGGGGLVFYVIAGEIVRVGSIAIFASVLLVGMALVYSRRPPLHFRGKPVIYSGLVVIVVITCVLSVGTVYGQNAMMDDQFKAGTEWTVAQQDHTHRTYANNYRKVLFYTQGFDGARTTPTVFDDDLPRNLGYRANSSITQTVETPGYIVITERDVNRHLAYPDYRWPGFGFLVTSTDRATLTDDPGAEHVYSSGGYSVWQTAAPPPDE